MEVRGWKFYGVCKRTSGFHHLSPSQNKSHKNKIV